jgi:hypothetical protein
MSKELNLIRRVLMGNSFNKDGYEYRFLSIDSDEKGWAYDIVVDVTLPKKGQSYATPVFSGHIHDILSNIWKYIGTSFSYSEKILVDGEEPAPGGVFISETKQNEIISAIRKEIRSMRLKTNLGYLAFNVNWKPSKRFYALDDVYLDFIFNLELFHFSLDGSNAEPNLKIADDVAGAIRELILDNDNLREQMNNVIYDVMSDEIDITSIDDLYYQVVFYITKIDGFEVDGKWGNAYDLEPDMFI